MSEQQNVAYLGMLAMSFPARPPSSVREEQIASGKRFWLKGYSPASLFVDSKELTIFLQGRPLIQYDLGCAVFQYKLLSAEQTGGCGLFVGIQGPVMWCFAMDSEACWVALEKALVTSSGKESQREKQNIGVHPAAEIQSNCGNCSSTVFTRDVGGEPNGMNTTSAIEGIAQGSRNGSNSVSPGRQDYTRDCLAEETDDRSIRKAIEEYLLDPAFHAYVDRVESIWNELEAPFTEEAGGHESKT